MEPSRLTRNLQSAPAASAGLPSVQEPSVTISRAKMLAWVALGLFLVSHMIPAFDAGKHARSVIGFTCLRQCANRVAGLIGAKDFNSFLQSAYFSSFVITNMALVIIAGMILANKAIRRWLRVAIILFALHVLSWWVWNMAEPPFGRDTRLLAGYYIWLAAYGILTYAVFKYRKPPSSNL